MPDDTLSYGLQDNKIFDDFMNNQRHPLESGIAGAENMNFLYNTMLYGQQDDPKFTNLRTAFRDEMLKAY